MAPSIRSKEALKYPWRYMDWATWTNWGRLNLFVLLPCFYFLIDYRNGSHTLPTSLAAPFVLVSFHLEKDHQVLRVQCTHGMRSFSGCSTLNYSSTFMRLVIIFSIQRSTWITSFYSFSLYSSRSLFTRQPKPNYVVYFIRLFVSDHF